MTCIEIATTLRNDGDFGFEMLVDVCGVDYLSYGSDEWTTSSATGTGFSRGVERDRSSLMRLMSLTPGVSQSCITCFLCSIISGCACVVYRYQQSADREVRRRYLERCKLV